MSQPPCIEFTDIPSFTSPPASAALSGVPLPGVDAEVLAVCRPFSVEHVSVSLRHRGPAVNPRPHLSVHPMVSQLCLQLTHF